MKRLITIIFLLPITLFAQNENINPEKRFHPFIALNYNLLSINYISDYHFDYIPNFSNSNFFGAEFGFTLLPKKENGFFF